MRKFSIWVLFLTATIPLIVAPNLITYDVGGKVTLVRGLAFVIIALITLAVFFEKKQRTEIISKISDVIKKPLFLAVAVNTILLVLSTIFAYDRISAFFGEPFRAEGFLTIFAFVLISFGMIVAFVKKDWNRYFLFTWIVSLIVLVFELKEVFSGELRPDSLLGNPIFLATYLLFSIFVSGLLWLRGREENKPVLIYSGIISAIVFAVGIFLTNTRGTIFALAFAVFVVMILGIVYGKNSFPLQKFGQKSLRFWSATFLVLALVFSGTFLATRKADFWQKIPGFDRLATTSLSEGTAASRIKFTQVSINGFFKDSNAKTFLVGWGLDNYVYFFQDHYDPQIYHHEDKLADRAHNKLVDVLIMSGILGILSYLAIWFYLFKYSFKILKEKLSLGILLIFFLTAFFVNNFFAFDVAVTYLAIYSIIAFVIFEYSTLKSDNSTAKISEQ